MTSARDGHLIKVDELPRGENSAKFEGHEHGEVLFTVGESAIEARAGDIVVVPAGAPHRFVSRSATHRQISIHPAARMKTEWLE
jgi:uncharacterized protein YjlB